MITAKELTWICLSYCLGCFTAGYYWVRWRTGEDIRAHGSGNVGAKNVGRRLGTTGFIITFLLDFAKGAAAVSGADYLALGPHAVAASMLAVVAGHNWPFQLRFHGGKGIAASLGALLAYDPIAVGVLILIFLPFYAFWRSFTLSGLVAFALTPLGIFFDRRDSLEVTALTLLAVIILVGHRKNIREESARIFAGRPVKDSPSPPQKGAAP